MAAKSKKRLSKNENKLLKLEKLELKDIVCSICQSILVEPVTLPCYHDFCQNCFKRSVENNALCCPLCRLRVGSWLRNATKQQRIVNIDLWNHIKTKYPKEIECKIRGEEVTLPEEKLLPKISAPGEIRSEYQAEVSKIKSERLDIEKKQFQETETLIKKIQAEETKAQKQYLERIKEDELLAKKLQNNFIQIKNETIQKKTIHKSKPKLKAAKIDKFLTNLKSTKESSHSNNKKSKDESSSNKYENMPNNLTSPELVPSYEKIFKKISDKKMTGPGMWNKENGEKGFEKKDELVSKSNLTEDKKMSVKPTTQSLPVSLPYTGILQHKINVIENRHSATGSVDSMQQELCYFKPIQVTTPTRLAGGPVRVPSVRAVRPGERAGERARTSAAPSRSMYLDGLCRLRKLSLAQNLPSAFVIAINLVTVKKEGAESTETTTRSKLKKMLPSLSSTLHTKKTPENNKSPSHVDEIIKSESKKLRRTRSMGSILKTENETTPKKSHIKVSKSSSERKPCLRSNTKKINSKMESNRLSIISETVNNNKVDVAVKNLSSPLDNCDVKKLLKEQIRIVKIIEQEKSDFELARKLEAEWNERRQPRRTAVKRPVGINYCLRPAKKLKL